MVTSSTAAPKQVVKIDTVYRDVYVTGDSANIDRLIQEEVERIKEETPGEILIEKDGQETIKSEMSQSQIVAPAESSKDERPVVRSSMRTANLDSIGN